MVPPGEYELEVWSDLLGFDSAAIVVTEGESVTHNFVAAGGSLTGTVTALVGGAAIEDATVVVVRPGDREGPVLDQPRSPPAKAVLTPCRT